MFSGVVLYHGLRVALLGIYFVHEGMAVDRIGLRYIRSGGSCEAGQTTDNIVQEPRPSQ